METPEQQKLHKQLHEVFRADPEEKLIFIGWLKGKMGDAAFYEEVRAYLEFKPRGVRQREFEATTSR